MMMLVLMLLLMLMQMMRSVPSHDLRVQLIAWQSS